MLMHHGLAKLIRRTAAPAVERATFAEQEAFVTDPSERKAALCSRRAGKSHALAEWFDRGATPGTLSLYVALSSGSARLILWPALRGISERYGLGLVLREERGQQMVCWPNGHRLWLAGCPDRSEIEKFRGLALRRAAVDEAQAFGGWLEMLTEDVLTPALGDLRGQLALTGTPGPIAAGTFHEATTGRGWSVHHWTVAENPFFPAGAEWRAGIRAARGWTEDHPTYRREYLGEWVQDADALVFPFDYSRNAHAGPLPEGPWRYVLACDLGYVDSTAFVELAYRHDHPDVHIVRAWKRERLIPSAFAATVDGLRKKRPYAAIVCDTGGLGKGYAEELRQRYAVPVVAAEKQAKRGAIELMRGDLRAGTVKVHASECAPLLDEWGALQWSEDRTGIDERTPDHCADAALYGFRECRSHYKPAEDDPKPNSPEWWAREQRQLREAEKRKQAQRLQDRWRR